MPIGCNDNQHWDHSALPTGRSSGAPSRTTQMTLKEQERVIDEIKKENFGLKMKIYYLEERQNKNNMAPEEMENALKENLEIKLQNHELKLEFSRYKKLYSESEKEVEALRKQLVDQNNHIMEQNSDGSQHNDDILDDDRDITIIRLKESTDKAEKQAIFIQELKGQISILKTQLYAKEKENENLSNELESIKSLSINTASPHGDIPLNGDFSEQYEDSLGNLRDKVAELTLQLHEKGTEVEQLAIELEDGNMIHSNTVQDIAEEMMRIEKENAILRDELEMLHTEHEQVLQELDLIHHGNHTQDIHHKEIIDELTSQLEDNKHEIAELHQLLEKNLYELENKSKELQELRESFDKSKFQISNLESSIIKKDEEIVDLQNQLESKSKDAESEQKLQEEVISDLKKKLSSNKAKITELTSTKESTSKQINLLRQEIENYTAQIEELKQSLDYEIEHRNIAESRENELIVEKNNEKENHEKELEKLRKEKKEIEKQEEQKINELNEKLTVAQQQILDLNMNIEERDADLQFVRQQLNKQSSRTKDTTERYLKEQERLRSELDIARQESEQLSTQLENLGDELENKKNTIIEYENEVKHLNNMKNKLNEKFLSSENARIKAEEQFRNLQMDTRDKDSTIDELRSQVANLENNLSQEKKVTYSNETQHRDQIIERNTLLMTAYQYLDALMSDGSNKQSNYPKPSTNFKLFHEQLLSKLKTISAAYNNFDSRVKEIVIRWQEQYESLKNQMDLKISHIAKLENAINKIASNQEHWKEQARKAQNELEITKSTNEELNDQMSSLRQQLEELRNVKLHANELENKLKEGERQIRIIESKFKDDERKWEMKLKDLEFKDMQSVERFKNEAQTSKERIDSLNETLKDIETQLQAQIRRNNQLQELNSIQKASMEATNESKAIAAKAESTFAMLNEQLREQMEEKNKTIESERQRIKKYEEQEQKRLHDQIGKRDVMINKALSGLQLINQRKDLMENAIVRQLTEEMQTALMLDGDSNRRQGYQPPQFINPPWKPAGSGNGFSLIKKPKSTNTPAASKSAIPTISSLSKKTSLLGGSNIAKPSGGSRLPISDKGTNNSNIANINGSVNFQEDHQSLKTLGVRDKSRFLSGIRGNGESESPINLDQVPQPNVNMVRIVNSIN
ncbi:3981_t:CDS:10 [Entrophospora sp. SA101]|nr:3981_t:CDS:10 [Entrophospora sp. SA101]